MPNAKAGPEIGDETAPGLRPRCSLGVGLVVERKQSVKREKTGSDHQAAVQAVVYTGTEQGTA